MQCKGSCASKQDRHYMQQQQQQQQRTHHYAQLESILGAML
jgi:hypothetical protein